MIEFVALRPKTCSYLIDDSSGNKKAKDTKKQNKNLNSTILKFAQKQINMKMK